MEKLLEIDIKECLRCAKSSCVYELTLLNKEMIFQGEHCRIYLINDLKTFLLNGDKMPIKLSSFKISVSDMVKFFEETGVKYYIDKSCSYYFEKELLGNNFLR